jgi:hypothetical protein
MKTTNYWVLCFIMGLKEGTTSSVEKEVLTQAHTMGSIKFSNLKVGQPRYVQDCLGAALAAQFLEELKGEMMNGGPSQRVGSPCDHQ